MILTLDVGNTQIFGGVFDNNKLILHFRKSSRSSFSSDEIGIFLRSVLKENEINPALISGIAICSVVPELNYPIRHGCIKYFSYDPFMIQPGIKTGLKIKYNNPAEVGSDRIANSIAGTILYPDRDLIIIDFGTATTFDVISKNKDYLGGAIVPGLKISMEALQSNTAKLPSIELDIPERAIGRSTKESIQSGLYFGNIGIVKELVSAIKKESFINSEPLIIATGGFSSMFKDTGLFNAVVTDLVLQGTYYAYKLNAKKGE